MLPWWWHKEIIMAYSDPNDPQHLINEAQEFFLRVAAGCRAYSDSEITAAILKLAEYIYSLAQALLDHIAGKAHLFAQAMREIEAHDISPSLANLAE